MVLSDKIINEILDSLDNSIIELAKGASESLEFQSSHEEINSFLSSQYEIRLQNLLNGKNVDIHYLESGIKNKIIQRKQKTLEDISKLFKI